MLLRLTPELGVDRTVYSIIAMNNTGSDMLSLFTTDYFTSEGIFKDILAEVE